MIYYLSYLNLIYFPFLVAINPLLSIILTFYCKLKIRMNLAFFIFISFIIYDYMILFLLHLNIEFEFVLFQGWIFLIIGLYSVYFKIYLDRFFLLFGVFLLFSTLQGIVAGSSIVNVVNFLKAITVFPILLILQNKFEWKLSLAQLVFILCMFVLCLILDTYQTVMGFEEYFLSMGIDLFYHQRDISELGKIPIGIMTNSGFQKEETRRVLGIFLSPDKFGYLIYVINMLLFSIYMRVWKYNTFSFVIFALLTSYLLYLTLVKAVLLNYLVFMYSVFLYKSFKVSTFGVRLFVVYVSVTISAILLIYVIDIDLSRSGAIQHIWGLVNPIVNMFSSLKAFFIGGGVGTAKSAIPLIGEAVSKADAGNESFIGLLVYQTGILGVIFIFRLMIKIDNMFITSPHYMFASSMILGVYVSSVFSEAVFSFFQVACYILSFQLLSAVKVRHE
jgi:hypothetical protein